MRERTEVRSHAEFDACIRHKRLRGNKMAEAAKFQNRRFAVEEIDNGFLLKITELGSDKLLARSAYLNIDTLIAAIREHLSGSAS